MRPWNRRIALLLVLAGGVLAVVGVVTMIASPAEYLPPDNRIDSRGKASIDALLSTLLVTFAIVLAFLVGSYLMVRIGRSMLDRSPPSRTEYVDAWGSYRLTDEQVSAATADEPDPDDRPDDAEPPRPRQPDN